MGNVWFQPIEAATVEEHRKQEADLDRARAEVRQLMKDMQGDPRGCTCDPRECSWDRAGAYERRTPDPSCPHHGREADIRKGSE